MFEFKLFLTALLTLIVASLFVKEPEPGVQMVPSAGSWFLFAIIATSLLTMLLTVYRVIWLYL